MIIRKTLGRVGLVSAVALAASPAFAAAVDTSSVTTAITEAATALAVVGAAFVAMRYGSSVWKWLTKFSS